MSKRSFRAATTPSAPRYPTLRRFLGRGGIAAVSLALSLLAAGCPEEHLGGVADSLPSLIDARADGAAEAAPRTDGGAPTDAEAKKPEAGPTIQRQR